MTELAGPLPVESHLTEYLAASNQVRAKLWIESLPAGDWLDVVVRARVYNLAEVERLGRLPESPLAEGTDVPTRACSEPTVVDLPLPEMPYGKHAVIAKVYSSDDRYRQTFEPSRCYVGTVVYGLRPVRMRMSDLLAVYTGINNPLAQDYIRSQVRAGGIEVVDDSGRVCRVREVGGQPVFSPLT